MTGLLWLGGVLYLLALVAVGLRVYGERRWARRMQALRSSLDASHVDGGPATPTRYDARELEGLPAPVQRYFRSVMKDGQPIITAVNIDMAGTFNLSPTGAQWKPFTSHQRVTTRRPGFVWDARIMMLPGVAVRVVDSYIAGQGVRWRAVDAHSATATLVDGPLSLSLLFRFNEAGLIGSFRAEARGSWVGGKMVMAPWEGSWSNYQRHDGVLVPCTGEVAWMRPEGRKSYFVGTVTALSFECLS